MNCGETRECLFAFLENELDALLSIELQRHLDVCGLCAREAEIERTINDRLGRALTSGYEQVDLGMIRSVCVEKPVTESSGGRLGAGLRRSPAIAAAAVLGVALGGVFWLVSQNAIPTIAGTNFGEFLVADYEHFLEENESVQLASRDPDEVADWLFMKTAVRMTLPTLDETEAALVGGRKCDIDGKPAAFVAYHIKGEPVSLVAVEASAVILDTMTEVRRYGSTHWLEYRRGFTIVARRRDALIYAAVSTLSERELLPLIEKPRN